nr:piggyBac transposable element-derived protein 3-like [Lepeophtheirus salmonis]XP_040563530.1 piggyBac transposable element-derived protein 3-like [Lepeophtheirus salmonis]
MRRDRFIDILHNIHFHDNTLETNDRASKLRPLIDHIQKKFIEHGGFPEHLAIDESMIPYFGKHFAKQFIRGRPIRFGYKMWAMCSKGGYLDGFDLYMGKNDETPIDNVAKIGLGGNVVLNLIKKSKLPANHGHKIFFDNYFTSISLMEELKTRGYLASGTCRDNRTEKCPISEKNWMKNEPRGAVDQRMSDDILLIKWKDNKEVSIATNFDSTILKSTRRYIRNEKKYKQIQQPACFQQYNSHMGYVDIMDQAISTYRVRIRQKNGDGQYLHICYRLL